MARNIQDFNGTSIDVNQVHNCKKIYDDGYYGIMIAFYSFSTEYVWYTSEYRRNADYDWLINHML